MDELLNWNTLGTMAGIAAAVSALTQILKQFMKIDPKWIALALSVVISLTVQIVGGDMAAEAFILSALNAILAAGTAVGMYESVIKPVVRRMRGAK